MQMFFILKLQAVLLEWVIRTLEQANSPLTDSIRKKYDMDQDSSVHLS